MNHEQMTSLTGTDMVEQTAVDAMATTTADAVSLDDILDEIDDVLATDAESFVQGFVQKGGQ